MQNTYKYKKVLIVDDNEIDTFVNMKIMENIDFAETIIVKNSEVSALEYFTDECKTNDDFPDVIFLNPAMSPERKGDFIKEFQKFPKIEGKNRLIIISVMEKQQQNDLSIKRKAIYQALSKPLTLEELLKI
jgi:CheY-like chemotaxis protein